MDEAQRMSDAAWRHLGFLSGAETAALAHRGIVLPDPGSVLVSSHVRLEEGVILWPSVILQAVGDGRIAIGQGTNLFPGTRIVASGGSVTIRAEAEIGEEGGFTVKAGTGETIEIGDQARLLGGGSLTLCNRIGRGAQILGPIRCQNCVLGDGGSHREPEPDERGGVLKGSGVARHVEVPRGHVIQAFGLFADAVMRRQSYFHPRLKRSVQPLRQAKGGKVLAVPAFIAATTIMLASSSSSVERGQTSALVVQPDARKASCRSRNS